MPHQYAAHRYVCPGCSGRKNPKQERCVTCDNERRASTYGLPGIPRSRVTARPPAGEDLTGYRKDFLLVLGPTDEIRSDRRMWACFCTRCGATFRRSKARIVEAVGACEGCARDIRPPPACKVCRSPDHTAADCPQTRTRPRTSICGVCGNLAHRRERPRCPRCRKPYQDEQLGRADGDRRDGERQMLYGGDDPA